LVANEAVESMLHVVRSLLERPDQVLHFRERLQLLRLGDPLMESIEDAQLSMWDLALDLRPAVEQVMQPAVGRGCIDDAASDLIDSRVKLRVATHRRRRPVRRLWEVSPAHAALAALLVGLGDRAPMRRGRA